MISRILTALTLCALTLTGSGSLHAATAGSAGGSSPKGPTFGHEQTVSVNGPAVCNCTGTDAELSVCHSETVGITFGSSSFSVSTGQSSSSCASQTAAPGECLFLRYTFRCSYRGVFSGWECHLLSTGLHSRPADSKVDC